MIVHKKNHSKSCSINQLNSKWNKIIAFSLVTSVVAGAVIINTRNNVWCDGSLPLKTRLSKKKYWFLYSRSFNDGIQKNGKSQRVFMMTAPATTDVARENAIILFHFEFNWFIEHDFEWFFLWTIMLSLILMLSLYFRLFIVFFEKVAEINLNLNLNLKI